MMPVLKLPYLISLVGDWMVGVRKNLKQDVCPYVGAYLSFCQKHDDWMPCNHHSQYEASNSAYRESVRSYKEQPFFAERCRRKMNLEIHAINHEVIGNSRLSY